MAFGPSLTDARIGILCLPRRKWREERHCVSLKPKKEKWSRSHATKCRCQRQCVSAPLSLFKVLEDRSPYSMKKRTALKHPTASYSHPIVIALDKARWVLNRTLALSLSFFERSFFLSIVVIKHAAHRPIACEQSERVSPKEIAKFLRAHLTTIANRVARPCGRPP